MKKLSFIIVIISLVLTSAAAEGLRTIKITRIVDGDTVYGVYQGRVEKVRLIGIDTPESRYNYKTKRDSKKSGQSIRAIIAQGKQATRFVKSLIGKGSVLKIEFDSQLRDRYGRFLAYLYLEDGRMLNEEIIRAGYASVMTIPPNVKYQGRFLKAFRKARESRVGLWR